MSDTIVERIFRYANENPDKTAVTDGQETMTYGQLVTGILYAKSLLAKKYELKKGDMLIIGADKQLSFVTVYFACHLLGVIVLPLAPDTNSNRFQLIYSKVTPKLVIGFEKEGIVCPRAFLDEFCVQKNADVVDRLEYDYPELTNVADIIFTTGTTGMPKGVLLTQQNIAAAAENINTFINNQSEDIELLVLPVSHSFGLGRMRCALSNGQTLVILGSFANLKKFYQFLEEYNITGFGMVPASWAMIRRLSGSKLGEYADRLHYIEIGSAPMPLEDKNFLIALLPNTRICMHYGLTEASRSAFIEFHTEKDRLDTVGRSSPNMHIEIRDEQGNIVPNGTEGEICVRGKAVTSGYYGLGEENQQSFWGEYFRTGDWGIMDSQGYICLISRKKELINVGGKKVSPIEVEEALLQIKEIADCACIGVPDPEGILGEVVKAYVVLKEGCTMRFKDISKQIRGMLEDYKVPTVYEFIDRIPKTSSGKVQRLSLKKKD